ncbi:MAG: HAD-IIIA family hydrolase [Clostridium sp.]|nr:HAD-IIIA family hydrolase [Prevotella sp.]MCM1428798.1 HAD-IIIA family hydrolase [Clostridium sp.]MCM1475173.1 HAD-IIIA family hydrolase [Muribaculaceae bacterium]
MSGINYDLKRIRAVAFDVDGVLSPSTIPMSSEGEPLRMVNIKDGYALQLAVKCGLHIAIITGGNTRAVEKRYNSLGIKDIYQKAAHKLPVLQEWMKKNNLKPEEVAYMGDDIPDLKCLRYVGLPCCPYDAVWEVKDTCLYISPYTGGYGCGRDLLEQILKANGHWLSDAKAFGW